MKRIALIIFALFISGCAAEKAVETPPPVTTTAITEEEIIPAFSMDEPRMLDYTEVNFRIRTSRITTDTSWLDYELNNRSDTEFLYGEHFTLFKNIDGGWSPVDMMHGTMFSDIGLILMPDSINNSSIDIGYFFGILSEGDYLIAKDIFTVDEWCMVSAEFTVFEDEK